MLMWYSNDPLNIPTMASSSVALGSAGKVISRFSRFLVGFALLGVVCAHLTEYIYTALAQVVDE